MVDEVLAESYSSLGPSKVPRTGLDRGRIDQSARDLSRATKVLKNPIFEVQSRDVRREFPDQGLEVARR